MVIPVHDRNPARRTPYVTYALIAVNVVVFLAGPVAGFNSHYGTGVIRACAQQLYFVEHGAIPKELLANHGLHAAEIQVDTSQGAQLCPLVILPHKVPFFSVITAIFIHAGWVHLLGNMLFLWVFGDNVEDRMGRVHFAIFYLVTGYVSTYAFAIIDPNSTSPLVGASGAIAGVLGAYFFLYPRAKVISLVPFLFFIPLRFPAWIVLGSWFLLQLPVLQNVLGSTSGSGVAYFAHVSGFILGLLYAWLVIGRDEDDTPKLPPSAYGLPPGFQGTVGPRVGYGPNAPYGPGNPYGQGNPYDPRGRR